MDGDKTSEIWIGAGQNSEGILTQPEAKNARRLFRKATHNASKDE